VWVLDVGLSLGVRVEDGYREGLGGGMGMDTTQYVIHTHTNTHTHTHIHTHKSDTPFSYTAR
jgi:hypothetical protein